MKTAMTNLRCLLPLLGLPALLVNVHAQSTTAATTTGSSSTTGSAQATTTACATGLHVIVARGSEEAAGEGRIGVVAGNVTERVPGSTVEAVVYPATFDDYTGSEGDGVAAIHGLVEDYVKRCPDARIALLGYSQGGQVAMDLICGTSEEAFNATAPLATSYEDNIVAVVTFGDPSHVANMTWNAGTSSKAGIFPRTNTSACKPYANAIKSWCDIGDVYCDSGSDTSVHGSYFANYTTTAVDFIVSRYNKTKTSGTASSTASASATHTPGSGAGIVERPSRLVAAVLVGLTAGWVAVL